TTPLVAAPSIDLDEVAAAPFDFTGNGTINAGDTIAYTYVVTNTGTTTLNGVTVTDGLADTTIVCPGTTLAPGATFTCTSTHTITQFEIEAGQVVNPSEVVGTPPTGATVTDTDTETTPLVATRSIDLDETAAAPFDADGNGVINAGDTIAYSFLVTNTGTVTLTNVTVTDGLADTTIVCPGTTLAPGASFTCTATHTITQANIDAGQVFNPSTVVGTPPTGATVTDLDSETTPLVVTPSIDLDESAATPFDFNGNGTIDAGDTVAYSFLVTNTGGTTLTNVTVTDGLADTTVVCPTRTLAPGATTTCTATHTLTQAEVDAGLVVNPSSVVGTPPAGATVTDTDTETTPLAATPSIDLVESAAPPVDFNGSGTIDAGDTVAYSFVVTNTGSVTLTGVTVADGLPGTVVCPATTLTPGASTTCTVTYTLTQADIDAGSVFNPSTATGTPPTGPNVTDTASVTTVLAATALIDLDETASAPFDANGNGVVNAGDTIAYSFLVTNTGTVTLTNVTVTDGLADTTVVCPTTTLAPGASTTCTATHTITQANIDAGQVFNPSTVVGTPPTGADVTDTDAETTPLVVTPSIDLDETAAAPFDFNGSGSINAGDTIAYSFLVTNTGGVTLTNVTVADGLADTTVVCPTRTLAPGASTTCTATHTITQAELDAGQVFNPSTVVGTPPTGAIVTDADAETTPLTPSASIDLVESAAPPFDFNGSGGINAGDQVAYSFVVTNTGSTTLTGVTVTDGLPGTVVCPATTLAPGASTTCTLTYTLTQADIDAGSVFNPSTATGTPPTGPDVTDTDAVTTPLVATASIDLDESAAAPFDVNGNGIINAGDSIAYSFLVTNTGTVTLTGVTVTDGLADTAVVCPGTTLAPGASFTCTTTHTLTQAEVDAGQVFNPSSVVGTPPTGANVTDTDAETTPLVVTPSISLVETAAPPFDANGSGTINAGDTIAYSFVVTNTGGVTLTGVTVTDGLPGTVVCPTTTLAPGTSTTCTATYTITQADVDNGSVFNPSTATGTPPTGPAVTDTDGVTTPLSAQPGVLLIDTSGTPFDFNGSGAVDAGDTIGYTFTVTNTGGVTLNGVTVSDGLPGTVVTCPATALAPGASIICTATYTITQADVDNGLVFNPATATGTPPTGPAVTDTDSATTPLAAAPGLDLVVTAGSPTDANGSGTINAGDTITYTYAVTNTGSTTLTGLTVVDGVPGTVVCSTTTLAPGATATCTVVHTITQAAIDAGQVVNPVNATATPPTGPAVGDAQTVTTPLVATPSIDLDESAAAPFDFTGNGTIGAGDTIAYSFLVTNTGGVTLTNVTVTDGLADTAIVCPATTLAPGASITCTATHPLTQAEVDAGQVVNPSSVVGTPPAGATVTDTDTEVAPLTATPGITLDESAAAPVDANGNGTINAGDTITYSFLVTNSGSTTLTGVAVSDNLPGAVVCPTTTLAPGAATTCTHTYTLTQADVDAGQVTNPSSVVGTPPTGPAVAAIDTETTPLLVTPSIDLDESAAAPFDFNGNGTIDAGDSVAYSFVVTNTGGVTLTNVAVTDGLADTTVVCPTTTLAPGASTTCTATHFLTQAELDAGQVVNPSSVVGTPPTGATVADTDTETTPLTATPGLDLVVTAAPPLDANGSGTVNAGDTIAYTYTLTNTGSTTLTGLTVGDGIPGTPVCTTTTLAPGATTTCTATYTITQADINAGQVFDPVTASGTPPTGPAVTDTASATTPLAANPSIDLDESAGTPFDANGSGTVNAGDTIAYTFVATNTGTVTLTGVTVTDALADTTIVCPSTTLAPGASITCTATHTITQAELDAGQVFNPSSVVGTPPTGPAVTDTDSETTPLVATPSVDLVESAAPPFDFNGSGTVNAGDTVAYTFVVTNTGGTTLTNVTVADGLADTTVVCPTTTLAPGASTTCTATHTLTQAEVDAGQVFNPSTATGTPPTGPAVTDTDSATTPLAASPALLLITSAGPPLDANGSGSIHAGDTVAYTFVVTNGGSTTLTGVTVTDGLPDTTVVCPTTTLAPGASITCTATHTITQAEVNAGQVFNPVTATGTPPTGPAVTATDAVTTPLVANAAITIDETAAAPLDTNGNGVVNAGDTIAYSYLVTNTGTVTLSGVTVSDGLADTTIVCPAMTLAPGASFTCTSTHTITQADIDAGQVINPSSVVGTPPTGPTVNDADTVTTPLTATPSIDLVASATPPFDANGSGTINAGDTITYSFVLTNTGGVTLTGVTVVDGLPGTVVCPLTTLAPGATTTCTVTYTLTQADIDAGSVFNPSTATGTPPTGPTVNDTAAVSTSLAANPAITIDETAAAPFDVNGSGAIDAGDTVAYSFLVTNTGTTTLTAVTVTDGLADTAITCPGATLAPGASVTCTATHTLSQADIDAGQVVNPSSVVGTPPTGPAVSAADVEITPLVATPSISLVESAAAPVDANGSGTIDAGDTVAYTFVVTNTGGTTLTGITVADGLPDTTVVCPVTTLAPGASTTCTAVHTLTQAQVDAGQVTNPATVSGTPPTGPAVTDSDTVTTPLAATPSVTLTETAGAPFDANGSGTINAGDTVAYTFVVTNTGGTTLTNVTVTDGLADTTVVCPAGTLAPGATATCTATHTITQAEVDAGQVFNPSSVVGTPPTGPTVSDTDTVTTPLTAAPSISLVETAGAPFDANGSGSINAGDAITFSFEVTNTGSATLTGVTVTDSLPGTVVCPTTTLAPGATTTCTLTYTLTQADVDAGQVSNPATATGTPPTGPAVTDNDTVTTPLTAAPSITIDETAAAPLDFNGSGTINAGDTVAYTFLVTNTGSTTLTNVAVTDGLADTAVVCPGTTLAPGASFTCTATHTITQAEVDAGQVTNPSSVVGTPPTGPVVTDTDTATTPLAAAPSIDLAVTAGAPFDANGSGTIDAGDTITYSFVVTNTGSATLSGITVVDGLPGAVVCPVTTLAPGASTTCTLTYTITQADIDAGAVTNPATASGTPPTGPAVSTTDSVTTPLTATPSITLDETAATPFDFNGNGTIDAGDQVAYSFLVTNTGGVTLANVTVTDGLADTTIVCPATTLAPGASFTCTATHTITQANIDAGQVVNPSSVTGTPPTGAGVTAADTETTPLTSTPSIDLVETAGPPTDANGSGTVDAGDTITYTYSVTNTGSTTLVGLVVADGIPGTPVCAATTLAPGATTTCTATYTITQADIDAGQVTNPATATGTPPTGPAVADNDTVTTPLTATPSISIVETAAAPVDANGSGTIDAGDTVAYSFLVTNTGGVTLTDVTVTDGLGDTTVVCPGTALAPGASFTCTATHTLTQAEINAGQVVNPSTVVGTPPTGADVTDADVVTTPLTATPSITLDETAGAPVDTNGNGVIDAGDSLTYSFLVTNTGGVTLTGVTVTDGLPGTVVCPSTTLAPGATTTCTLTYTLTQADIDAGQVTNPSTVAGTPPNGPVVTDTDTVSTPLDGTPGITIDESAMAPFDANANGVIDAGDTITYMFLVTNTGGVTLTGVTVVDGLPGTVVCPSTTLAPGASMTCSVVYTLTQADIDAGQVVNPSSVVGTPPTGAAVTDTDTLTTPIPTGAAIDLDETAGPIVDANGNGVVDAGDTITYEFLVTNTGGVTLTGVVVVDGLPGTVVCPSATLAPGASMTCTVTYVLTQADIDAGQVVNPSTVTGTPPTGPDVTDADTETTPIDGADVASLRLDKQAGEPVDVNDSGTVDAGDTIAYTFVVTNTGDVPLTAVAVVDQLVGAVSCPTTTLAAGATTTCTASYTIKASDVAAGSVTNVATVAGLDPTGTAVTSPADSTVSAIPALGASLELEKNVRRLVDVDGNDLTNAGDQVVYEFVVTNTGDLPFTDVEIDDPMLQEADVDVTCPTGTLAPGETVTCVADPYTITAADVTAGEIVNEATVVAVSPDGDIVNGNNDTVVIDFGDEVPPPTTGDGDGDDGGIDLPGTGATIEVWQLLLGLGVLLAGLVLMVGGRRRRHDTA
ncbi:hypothetical protein, partial [Nocardioides sp.]|uniref:DUF7507 domain-containing protein n=1 Tax=Nocardioides sp. TaxID=35761 RepID=UPI0027247CAF|nr:hypothetical protein [Nocardioides sp.]